MSEKKRVPSHLYLRLRLLLQLRGVDRFRWKACSGSPRGCRGGGQGRHGRDDRQGGGGRRLRPGAAVPRAVAGRRRGAGLGHVVEVVKVETVEGAVEVGAGGLAGGKLLDHVEIVLFDLEQREMLGGKYYTIVAVLLLKILLE